MIRKIILSLSLIMAFQIKAESSQADQFKLNTVSIGIGSNCDFDVNNGDTLNDALSSTATEIRLVNNTTYVGQFVPTRGVSLRGGYNSCADAINDIQGSTKSVLDGNNNSGTILILQVNGNYFLENLTITNGQTTGHGGGIALTASDLNVSLDGLLIENNTANLGGGIYKKDGFNALLTIKDSIIKSNLATTDGGGIYFGNDGELVVYGETEIKSNTARRNGGGIMIRGVPSSSTSGSTIATFVAGENLTSGIFNNGANITGGGMFMIEANVNILGGIRQLSGIGEVGFANSNYIINSNQASLTGNGSGGGIFIYDSIVDAQAITITSNSSNFIGGGIGLFSNADGANHLTITRPSSSSCQTTNIGCNIISNNKATTGGGIYSSGNHLSNGLIEIEATNFNNNRADLATIASVTSTKLVIRSSVMYDNGNLAAGGYQDDYAFSVGGANGILEINQSTAVNNRVSTAFIKNNIAKLRSYVNLFYNENSGGPWLENVQGVTLDSQFNCQLVDSANNSNDSSNDTLTVTPTELATYFISTATHDFHLKNTSSLIDYTGDNCVENPGNLASFKDIDGHIRTLKRDLGADESLIFDLIFKNGME